VQIKGKIIRNEKGECINSGYYIDNNRVNINIGSKKGERI
jgi:hypothetical protein